MLSSNVVVPEKGPEPDEEFFVLLVRVFPNRMI